MLNNDKAKTNTTEDILEFGKLYESISTYLSNYNDKDTLTISIEGEWGSGKTSMSNFIIEEIQKKSKMSIMKFSPWMITDLNKLIEYFFSELMKTILYSNKKAKKDELIDDFKKFVSFITPDKLTLGVAEYSFDKFFKNEESLFEIKEKIANYVSSLDSKILIVVDDIDRLTDSETEIFFRLIKGIADFDNLIYLLLFDKVLVSDSLKKFKNEDGEKYLDKIIQYSISIPKISTTTLKKEFISEISELYEPELNNIKWLKFLNVFNKYIKNLRDVKRLSNSLKIEYSLVKDNVNFIDFMVITLIKNQNNKFFNFIKNNKYLFLINHSKEDIEKYREKIVEILKIEDFIKYKELIEIIFPVLNNILVSYDTKNNYISSLKSFDYYFSFSLSNESFENEIVNTIDNVISYDSEFNSSLNFLIFNKKAIDFIDKLSSLINNNKYFITVHSYINIIKNLLKAYHFIKLTDDVDSFILKEKIMSNILFLIKKLDLNQLSNLFSHSKNSEYLILINHFLEEETFEKVSKKDTSDINSLFKTKIKNAVETLDLCTSSNGLITFKNADNYEMIYNTIKQGFKFRNFAVILNNHKFTLKESFFNIISEFKTYKIIDDKYIPILDKDLLFKFVNKQDIENYSHSLNISDLTKEEELLLELYWNRS